MSQLTPAERTTITININFDMLALFGSTAGVIMHPAYHTSADRLDTVNMKFLDDLSDAGAHAILWFAMDGQWDALRSTRSSANA
jgi:hypothetical protein